MSIHRRMGRVRRSIDVPLCAACARVLQRRSADEERLAKIGWLAAAVSGLFALAVGVLLTPAGMAFGLRLLLGLMVGGLAATAVLVLFRRLSARAALPEKQAIRAAARIDTFSWRTTTFAFENPEVAARFRALNETMLFQS